MKTPGAEAGRTDAGLYVHVPFCSAVCPYCDFAVSVARPERRARFVEGLLAEIEMARGRSAPGFDTIYFGGGTPSLLEPAELGRILAALRDILPVAPDAGITLEANPEDVRPESTAAWRSLGVGTLSLGVQSLDDAELRFLGRRHRTAGAIEAFEAARSAGFDTLSIDLIFGLPGQGRARWEETLERAAALGPDHVSCYQLTVHEGTHFGRRRDAGRLVELDEDTRAELFETTHRRLGEAGLEAYEVSNFAREPRHRSLHNRKYWNHTPYLGLGPSAHSFDGTRRWWNLPGTAAWEAALAEGRPPVEGSEELGPRQLALEALMLGLRTPEGIDLAGLREGFGASIREDNAPLIDRLVREGLLLEKGTRLAPTLRGLAVADALARALEVGGEGSLSDPLE